MGKELSVREALGLLGELSSHALMLVREPAGSLCKELGGRYIIMFFGTLLKRLCNEVAGNPERCIKSVGELVDPRFSMKLREVLELSEQLRENPEAGIGRVMDLLQDLPKIYVAVSRLATEEGLSS